jgi:hypothetical protein
VKNSNVVILENFQTPECVTDRLESFLQAYQPFEISQDVKLLLYFDRRSLAFYIMCHLTGEALTKYTDSQAVLDADEDEDIYKLNREITEDHSAYIQMEKDALGGRSFEDIVLEYDPSYRSKKPLKIYGGQHRLRAISKAGNTCGDVLHGVRVYFCLSREQKVEIARVNNTAIAVPNDLLDRMQEQLLGSELRDWCQRVGLLDLGEDFADRRSSDHPTVRIARMFIVNFYIGKNAKSIEDFHQPVLCKSGGNDENYLKIRNYTDWFDPALEDAGRAYSRLHKKQRESVLSRTEDNYAEYARRTLSMSVGASWAYAAGLFQRDPLFLKNLYSLPDFVTGKDDPLNAKALSQARHKVFDPDTYRGLGTRSTQNELGRMLEVFLVLATKANKVRINKTLANAAIQSYEAKRATYEAEKVLKRI